MKTVRSIELPDDVDYKLTKKSSLNKNFAIIVKGQTTVGPLRINPIKLGQGVVVGRGISNSIFTTEVTKIRVLKNKVVFHTLNSIYELVEVTNEK